MAKLELERLERLIERFASVRLLVVGDLVLDEYVWGRVDRVSPEAPVPVVQVDSESVVLGGAGNVVRNVVALGGSCRFCSVVGDDDTGRRAVDLLKHLGVDHEGVYPVEGRPTTRKTRVLAHSQQVVRFDRESVEPVPRAVGRAVLSAIAACVPAVDGAILVDYGKGLLVPPVARAAMRRLGEAELPVAVDPKVDLASYRGAALLKPNLRETQALSGLPVRSPQELAKAVARIRRRVGGADVVVTRGAGGMTLFEGDTPALEVATARREVFDVQGAGDTSIAALCLALRAGASLLEAAVIANAAAGVVVGKVGTATATPAELRALLPATIAAAGGTP